MPADAELFLLFGALHLIALLFAAMLFLLVLRTDTVSPWSPPADGEDDGGGGSPPRPQAPSGPRPGGVPLPDAGPARVRLREPARLADLLPARDRRPAREPERAPRTAPAK
jgi:hypothetical protein